MRSMLDGAGLWVAGLLSCGTLLASPLLLGELGLPIWIAVPTGLFLAAVVGLLGTAAHHVLDDRLFGERGPIESVEDLAASGLLQSTSYRARRACEIEAFDDWGPHYLLELEDLSILLLSGQFLCDYDPVDYDIEHDQPRRFPCTEFVVHQHRSKGYVIEIDCRGDVIEPTLVLDQEALEPIREALGCSPAGYEEVTHQAGTSFDALTQLR